LGRTTSSVQEKSRARDREEVLNVDLVELRRRSTNINKKEGDDE